MRASIDDGKAARRAGALFFSFARAGGDAVFPFSDKRQKRKGFRVPSQQKQTQQRPFQSLPSAPTKHQNQKTP